MISAANGGRYRETLAMPPYTEQRISVRGQIEFAVTTRGGMLRRSYTLQELLDLGWLEPVPWPDPDKIGEFI